MCCVIEKIEKEERFDRQDAKTRRKNRILFGQIQSHPVFVRIMERVFRASCQNSLMKNNSAVNHSAILLKVLSSS